VWRRRKQNLRATIGTASLKVQEETMADQEWTVKELTEELQRFPADAKVYYDMGPNGPETIGKAQYAKTWGDSKEMGVLLGR
jgi:hypothetical protein